MKITDIPFISHIGISDDLTLTHSAQIQNHLQSIHAGAIFSLAESASGAYLSQKFPTLKDKVIPLLRQSDIKYKNQAFGIIKAKATAAIKSLEKFTQ